MIILFFVILFQSKNVLAWGPECKECEFPPEVLFTQNHSVIDFSTKIDSLFYYILLEIGKLPIHGWFDYEIHKKQLDTNLVLQDLDDMNMDSNIQMWEYETHQKWLEPAIKNCYQVTMPATLFSLLNKTEQDSIFHFVKKNVIEKRFPIQTKDILKTHPEISNISTTACSIYASIESNGDYILSLNNTRYKMVELSNNHYVLRKEKEK